MRILVTGSSGLVGSALVPNLTEKGHEVYRLIRNQNKVNKTDIHWDPNSGILNVESLEDFNVIIHLAGENISSRRWSKNQKDKISQSRIQSTRLLVDKISETKNPPQLFISASAIGYYGSQGSELLTEQSAKGEGFLADLVQNWEKMAGCIQSKEIRSAFLRFGIILSERGGALAKLLLPFRLGLGSTISDGQQYMSWISLSDVVQIIDYIIQIEKISGPVNLVAPEPVTNSQYSKALGKALKRPVIFKAPSSILRLVLGEMADSLLLSSSRVIPRKLIDNGYTFLHPTIKDAFDSIFESKTI